MKGRAIGSGAGLEEHAVMGSSATLTDVHTMAYQGTASTEGHELHQLPIAGKHKCKETHNTKSHFEKKNISMLNS